MAQGTVTDYFPKKRKGGAIPTSKRPKMTIPLLEGAQPEDSTYSDTGTGDSVTLNVTKSALPKSLRGRAKTKTRQRKICKTGGLDSYFRKEDDSNSIKCKIPTSLITKQESDKTNCICTGSNDSLQNNLPTKESRTVTESIAPNVSHTSRHKAPKTQNHVKLVELSETAPSSPNDSPEKTCKNKESNGQKLPIPLSLINERGPDTTLSSQVPDVKDSMDRLKSAKMLLTKETAESLKEKLKNSGDLKSLQNSLLKMRQLKKERRQREEASLKDQQEKPAVSTSAKPSTPKKREFAYETLHSLSQEIPEGLPIPYKYKILTELFRCSDIVVGMLFNRKQVVTWTNLQKSVQEMSRKQFELGHLAQIKTVFPSGYQYRQEKGVSSVKDRAKQSEYQLTVEPMFDESDRFGGEKKLSSGMLAKRRHHFAIQLLNIVHEHHIKFLLQLSPPIEIPEGKTIRRWHPQFPLDTIPSPKEAELPQPPEKNDKCSNAKDIIENARNRFTKRAYTALKKVAERSPTTPDKGPPVCVEENNNECLPTKTNDSKPTEIKGVPQSLLARVRAKEAEKKLKCMVRSDELTKKLQQLDNLPDVARAMRMLYTSEKRASLPVEHVCKKLVKCSTSVLNEISVEEHVQLLIKTVPHWLDSINIKNTNYIKMNKTIELSDVLQRIAVERKKQGNST